jgi:hypothetical protein
METPMDLEPWQRLIIEALFELSDSSFQERVWLSQLGSEISSPGETVNQLFDDSGLGDLLSSGSVFSIKADFILRQMGVLIDTIDFEQSIEVLLVDKKWLEIRSLADKALNEINSILEAQ